MRALKLLAIAALVQITMLFAVRMRGEQDRATHDMRR